MSRFPVLFATAVAQRASDLHLRAGSAPRIRVNGDLRPINGQAPLTPDEIRAFHLFHRPGLAFNHDDFAFEHGGCSWRANASENDTGPALIIRLIPSSLGTLEEIGVPPAFTSKIQELRGLHLITGATGSGKTTTLAAVVRFLARLPIKIITLEDPIEQRHSQNLVADIQQREFGRDFSSYPAAIRAALRQDPDVILIAEMRDHETIRSALTAAETGHMVFSTLHNESAKDAITRIVDACADNLKTEHRALVAKQLVTCIAMQLVKRRAGGRIAVFELMVVTHAIAGLIRDGKTDRLQDEILRGTRDGMVAMNTALVDLVRNGSISREVARQASPDIKNFDILFPQ